MRDQLGLETITHKIEKELRNELDRIGLMYRLFSRVKAKGSIEKKVKIKGYEVNNYKITDVIGIRITLYFRDDVDLVYNILKKKSNYDHESTDPYSVDEFKPVRCNLTFNLVEPFLKEALSVIAEDINVVDTKYEVQIRTVLSEGWHEVEHDLRYKCKDDWNGHDDLNRNLNGIFATLETSEFSMLQMFENLAYRHYKDNKLEALLKTKFRVRLSNENLNPEIKKLILEDRSLMKKLFRVDRKKFLESFLNSKVRLGLTIDNLILLINHFEVKDSRISSFESDFVKGEFEN